MPDGGLRAMNYIVPLDTKTGATRAWSRRYLHMLYRETLKDYREAPTDWMRRATRQTLLNIWENYRNA
jgi:hypothetical protein